MQALNPTDSAFLWMETRHQPMHVAGLNLYTPPPGAGPDFIAELLAEWRQHLAAQSPFNLRPVLRLGLWYWEEDEEFELDYHLRHLALPRPGRIRELLAMVSRLHGNLMDRNRPLWEAYVIEGLPEGRFATYIKIHHALVDGVSGARIMAQGLSLTAEENKPPLWTQKYEQQSTSKRSPPGLLAQLANAARAGREILPGIGSGLFDLLHLGQGDDAAALPFQAPPTPFNVEISGSRRFAAQSYSLARFKRLGEAAGATVNDITLAICAGALRKYLQAQKALPRKPLIAMVPVSLRGETDAGGNQVSLLLANLATHLSDPLKRLARIVQSTSQAKERLRSMPRLQKLAHGITSISPMGAAMLTGSARQHPLFNVIISNVPGARETLFLNGARLDEVYPVSIPTQYLALNITISGYADKLGFGYIACRRSVPALQRMLDYTDESIAELEQALLPSRVKTKTAPVKTPARSRVKGKSTKTDRD
ncbi:MAG: wax ester/triacylglycerol synthase family O-acyltransferase [Rhodoferax sp.]|uniref:WS/DGAT/MGAT family O-acyltransferase n=1 Tax=Rhodoferax sp. TaxID=50421 RepID=UPI00261EFEF7|nr:wax ester/triacylglycerol synthase family O-acyltransferase [Rhodoferax sp.]MDD5333605.1 wax ester/triacylglycerol synthase family O-acyltransferase [Rhodoferax sp.]